jgi:acetoin utilization protein AcuB
VADGATRCAANGAILIQACLLVVARRTRRRPSDGTENGCFVPVHKRRTAMLVGQKMRKKVVTVKPTDTLATVKARMKAGKFHRVPVVESGKLVGIVSDRDLRQHTGTLAKTKVNAVMTGKVVTVKPSTMIETAARMLLKRKIGGMPVVDEGKLVGIITTSDLLRSFVDLVGAAEEGVSRIDMALDSELDRIQAATQIVAEEIGEILGLGTYQSDEEESPVFYLRVPADDAHRAADALRGNGFDVLAVHV